MNKPDPAPATDSIDPTLSALSEFGALTAREAYVVRLLCAGKRNAEIADELEISIKTVDTHRGHALKKLGEPNNVRLLIRALRSGFVTLEDL